MRLGSFLVVALAPLAVAAHWTPLAPFVDDECPPCFNCQAPGMDCKHYGDCDEYTGRCDCPAGFGGDDCAEPVCGSLPRGDRRKVRGNGTCDCDEGWSGVNCNMCTADKSCNAMMPEGEPGVCYTGGILVEQNFHMCNVTNRKILDVLKGRVAEVSFGCDRNDTACDLQLWVDQQESFYCKLSDCMFEVDLSKNSTSYQCETINCECVPDRLLCGADGSIDLTQWLQKSVRGPGELSCDAQGICSFTEPEMNKLIKYVFGDDHISLSCSASECLHYSQIPGYVPPDQQISTLWALGAITFVVLILFVTTLATKRLFYKEDKPTALPTEPVATVNTNPTTLQFDDVSYSIKGNRVLKSVFGVAQSGSVLAIMGGSGAGKTTLLDILAHKNKRGTVSGNICLNGTPVDRKVFSRLAGFVDQEDELLPTLTVYETVMTSALLRLPKTMSRDAKRMRALDTLAELGILHLRDQLIGSESDRGLSGGEKRRVAIACELVTSPSILFLDEPTSGLDAFNAFNVVQCLASLAKDYNRTVILTIHQPRSNIVSLLDKILLLADGELTFEGSPEEANVYFASIGYRCPDGYNIADYLIDLTMQAKVSGQPEQRYRDEASSSTTVDTPAGECPYPEVHTDPILDDPARSWRDAEFHQQLDTPVVTQQVSKSVLSVAAFARCFRDSAGANQLNREIEEAKQSQSDPVVEPFERIGTWQQIEILSQRTFKNLYRNPMLVLTHYSIAVILGLVCGVLYFHVSFDISGFQNRLGLFFFLLALFGFSTLTSISLFTHERLVFIRERANGYYSPFAYYCAKVFLDIVPLRVIPPLLLGLIVYPLVGLTLIDYAPFKFLLILVLFNLCAATIMLLVGILIPDFGVATLVGCLVNLFGILFAGLFLNQETMPEVAAWMRYLSIFHYAYEALSVNEVRYLSLSETKFGLQIEVPGATILSAFGFNNNGVPGDIGGLAVISGVCLVLAYFALVVCLVERR